jgi:hypothetical protein
LNAVWYLTCLRWGLIELYAIRYLFWLDLSSSRHNIELKYIWIETGYDTNTVWNLNIVLSKCIVKRLKNQLIL